MNDTEEEDIIKLSEKEIEKIERVNQSIADRLNAEAMLCARMTTGTKSCKIYTEKFRHLRKRSSF